MEWDSNTHQLITCARLAILPADAVYEELKAYAEYHLNNHGYGDKTFEKVLLARNDPLINLGLAQYAAEADIVADLYNRGCKPDSSERDEIMGRGLRIGCLSNQIVKGCWDTRQRAVAWLGDLEFSRLILEGDRDETVAMISNPSISGNALAALYKKASPFDALPDERWQMLVSDSSTNPRLNIDKGTEFGPDFELSALHGGILKLLETAPATKDWLKILHSLLAQLDPAHTQQPEGNIDHILKRWANVVDKKKSGGDNDQEEEGWLTSLSRKDEFLCLVGALYGRTGYTNGKSRLLGNPNSPDIALRCAYYGTNASLTADEMKAGFAKDKDVFVFAALLNDDLYFGNETRTLLEAQISGYLRHRYARRCDQIHKRWKNFDPKPISERGINLLDDIVPRPDPNSVGQLAITINGLKTQISTLKSLLLWGLIIVGAIAYLR